MSQPATTGVGQGPKRHRQHVLRSFPCFSGDIVKDVSLPLVANGTCNAPAESIHESYQRRRSCQ